MGEQGVLEICGSKMEIILKVLVLGREHPLDKAPSRDIIKYKCCKA